MNDLIKQFKLPKYIKGKSFAEASKLINDKFKDRNDVISKNTKNELLKRLADAQEYIKSKEQPQLDTNQNADGGFFDFEQNPNNANIISQGSNILSGVIAPGGTYGKQQVKNEKAGYFDNKLAKDQMIEQGLSTTQDAVASTFGPVGMAVRGAQKFGKSIGDAIGGEGGQAVSSVFDPTSSAVSNLTNKDLNFGEKALGILPGFSGAIAGHAAKRRLEKFQNEKRKSEYFNKYIKPTENFDGVNINALGGKINKYDGITESTSYINPVIPFDIRNLLKTPNFNPESINLPGNDGSKVPTTSQAKYNPTQFGIKHYNTGKHRENEVMISPEDLNNEYITENNNLKFKKDKAQTFDKNSKSNNIGDKLKNINGSALRYAPIAMDAFQLATMGKPEVEKLDRLNNQYQKQYLDEAAYENIARQQAAAASNAIGRSGVSTGQLINANLASQLNSTRAISEAYNKIKQHNIAEEKMRQQIEFGNNQANLSQSNLEKDINAHNRGAFKTERSKLLSSLGTNLGLVGKEELYKKYPEMMGMSYDHKGRYIVDKKGKKTYIDENGDKIDSDTNETAKGGYLSKSSLKYLRNK